jgi:hypothetical protein
VIDVESAKRICPHEHPTRARDAIPEGPLLLGRVCVERADLTHLGSLNIRQANVVSTLRYKGRWLHVAPLPWGSVTIHRQGAQIASCERQEPSCSRVRGVIGVAGEDGHRLARCVRRIDCHSRLDIALRQEQELASRITDCHREGVGVCVDRGIGVELLDTARAELPGAAPAHCRLDECKGFAIHQ